MLKTRITEQYGLRVPFINAGMAFIATAPLVRAVCNAGGMGMLGSPAMPPDVLQAAIRDVKAGGSLLGHEGNLVLKYFLLREAGRVQESRRVRSLRRIEKPRPLAPHIPDGGEHGYGDEVKNQEDSHHVVGHRAPEG